MLSHGAVLIHLDARRPGVHVPADHAGDPALVLLLLYDATPPIPDLRIDACAISATLSFDKKPYHCVVPWSAIYAAVTDENGDGSADGSASVWEQDVPAEARTKQ